MGFLVDNNDNGINVIIPMGGLGSRFAKNGYTVPKPLVPIVGRAMISWLLGNLKFQSNDTLHIALQRQVEAEYNICDFIRHQLIDIIQVEFILLDGLTRGAAETLYMVTKNFTEKQLKRRTISLDCDTIYFTDVLSLFRSLPEGHGCCAYFKDVGNKPIFSYIDFDENEHEDKKRIIRNIAEKKAISRNANTGAYGFPSASILNQYVVKLLECEVPVDVGEYYTSALISNMIQHDISFNGIYIDDFDCVGTPSQLVTFFHNVITSTKKQQIVKNWPTASNVIVIDLSSYEKERWTDENISEILGEKGVIIHDKASKLGLQIVFSLGGIKDDGEDCDKEGTEWSECCEKFKIAKRGQYKNALEKRHVVKLQENFDLQKSIGIYL